jgi:hypothetical protein
MTIVSDFRRNGSSVYQIDEYTVSKSINENNSASTFSASVNNFKGDNINNFNIGDEITIYYGQLLDFFNTPNNPNLTHYYDMNYSNGRDIYDKVGSLNFGFNGSPIWTSGISYNAVRISGVSDTPAKLRASSNGYWNVTKNDPISFSLWLNTRSTQAENSIITAAPSGISRNGIEIILSNGSFVSYRMYSSLTSKEIRNSSESSIFANGSWNHVVTTYNGIGDSSGAKIYLNGSDITSNIGSSTGITDISAQYAIFGSAGDNDFKLDEVAVFNKELSLNEVKTLYNSGAGIFLSNRLLFTGILENISLEGNDSMDEVVKLEGRDYTARLMDVTVEPEIYTNWEVGSIVRDIMSKYVADVTYSGVQTTATTLDRIVFNHKPVYDAMKDLASQAGYVFYVDEFKDLKFVPPGSIYNGYTFDSGNTIESSFEERRDSLYNQVWVYGDRYLNGFKETFTAGSPLGGSIFNLLYKPHNISITNSGLAVQPGDIYQMSLVPGSNIKYLVNYEGQQIIFTSGTSQGSNVPSSGNSVIITYDRLLPIVKVGDDPDSQEQYGKRVKVIVDKDIKDPNFAKEKMQSELIEHSSPKKEGVIKLRGIVDVTPSETCIVNLPFEGANNEAFQIISADYEFSKENNLTEDILTVKVNKRIDDLGDTIKQMMLDIKKLQAGDISTGDTLSRFNYSNGSFGIRQSGITIYTRAINDSFILAGPPIIAGSIFNSLAPAVTFTNLGSSIIGSQLIGSSSISSTYDSGLKVYSRFNVSGPSITNEITGTIGSLNGTAYVTSGLNTILGSALYTNAGGYAYFAVAPTISGAFTVCAWVYRLNAGGNCTVIDIGNYTANNGLGLWLTAGSWSYRVNTSIPNGVASTINTWEHVVMTYEPFGGTGSLQMWKNGSLITTFTGVGSPLVNTTYMRYGEREANNGPFAGRMDDLRVYNYKLSGGQIGSIFNNGSGFEYVSGGGFSNVYWYDHSNTLSGTTISQTGSSLLGSYSINGVNVQNYSNVYTGELYLTGSALIGSQSLLGSFAYDYDYTYSGLAPSYYSKYNYPYSINSVVGCVNPNSTGSIVSGGTFETGIGIGYDKAIKLGSPSYVVFPTGLNIMEMSGTDFTLSFWSKIGTDGATERYRRLLQRGLYGGGGWYIVTGSGANVYTIGMGFGSGAGAAAMSPQFGTFTSGVWTHLALTKAGSTYITYKDGSYIGSYNYNGIIETGSPLIMGRSYSTSEYMTGYSVDELRMYNRQLSQSEIGSLYLKQNVLGRLTAYYKFDEGAGSVAYNSASIEMPLTNEIAYWKFNNSGTYLTEENTRFPGLGMSGLSYSAGVFGNGSSLSLGSPSRVNLGSVLNGISGGDLSFSYWFNSATTGVGSNAVFNILTGPSSQFPVPYFYFGIRTGSVHLRYQSGTNDSTASVKFEPNVWNHAVGIFSGTTSLHIYLNGSLLSTTNLGLPRAPTASTELTLGVLNGGNNYSGLVDELRVYDRALSASEVLNLYKGKTIQPLLGDRRSTSILTWSGGYF